MRWRRARRTAYYQRLGDRFLDRMDATTAARCAAIKACHDGPDAMAALLDDLGERIAAERARHGIPALTVDDLVRREAATTNDALTRRIIRYGEVPGSESWFLSPPEHTGSVTFTFHDDGSWTSDPPMGRVWPEPTEAEIRAGRCLVAWSDPDRGEVAS